MSVSGSIDTQMFIISWKLYYGLISRYLQDIKYP